MPLLSGLRLSHRRNGLEFQHSTVKIQAEPRLYAPGRQGNKHLPVPSALYSALCSRGTFYLAYRLRHPLYGLQLLLVIQIEYRELKRHCGGHPLSLLLLVYLPQGEPAVHRISGGSRRLQQFTNALRAQRAVQQMDDRQVFHLYLGGPLGAVQVLQQGQGVLHPNHGLGQQLRCYLKAAAILLHCLPRQIRQFNVQLRRAVLSHIRDLHHLGKRQRLLIAEQLAVSI